MSERQRSRSGLPPGGSKGERTREAILDAATEVFALSGLGASTRQVAEAAGVTQPLLLHYFEGKDALVRAVIDRAVSRLVHRQQAHFAVEVDSLSFVLHGLHGLIEASLADPTLVRLATWARMAGIDGLTASAAAYWRAVSERMARAQAEGVVRSDIDIMALLLLVDASIKGLIERLPSYGRLSPERPTAESMSRALHRFVVRGVLSPSAWEEADRRLATEFIDR